MPIRPEDIWGTDAHPNPQTLGELIKYYRLRKGWTQAELGDRLNPSTSQERISLWELDKKTPRRTSLVQLARIFGVAPTEFVDASRNAQGKKVLDIDTRYLDAYDAVEAIGQPRITHQFVRIVAALAALLALMADRKRT